MPKTPPVVIPVIVDASGVDRGISDANRRLRYGTRGMAGTPSGFGSGGGPVAQGGGGGGFAGIAAGAVAGAVAGRVSRGGPQGGVYSSAKPMSPSQAFPGEVPNPQNNVAVSMWNRSQKRRDAFRNNWLSRQLFGGSQALFRRSVANYNIEPDNLANTGRYIMGGFGMAGSATLEAGAYAVGRGVRMGERSFTGIRGRMGGAVSAIRGAVSGGGKAASKALSLAGMGRFAGLGVAGAIPAILGTAINFQETMRSSFQDVSQFEGTMNYNAARRIRAYYNAPERKKPGFFQEFAIGAEMANTGGGTSLLGAYTTSVSEHYRAMARTVGGFLTSPFETIGALLDPNSELRKANAQGYTNVLNEWKRIMY